MNAKLSILKLKENWLSLPTEVRSFLKKALIVFLTWKLVYAIILFPIQQPDRYLTSVTATGTTFLLRQWYPSYQFSIVESNETYAFDKVLNFTFQNILRNNRKVVGIANGCNALELYVLYIGFLVCVPFLLKKFILFTTTGTVLIYTANIIRCTAIAVMNINHQSAIDVAHHYVFKILVYGLIFLLWVIYLRKEKLVKSEV